MALQINIGSTVLYAVLCIIATLTKLTYLYQSLSYLSTFLRAKEGSHLYKICQITSNDIWPPPETITTKTHQGASTYQTVEILCQAEHGELCLQAKVQPMLQYSNMYTYIYTTHGTQIPSTVPPAKNKKHSIDLLWPVHVLYACNTPPLYKLLSTRYTHTQFHWA